MRGLPIGKASALATPYLQMCSRSGEYMSDIYSGTYYIESLVGAPTVVKAVAPIDTVADKLGTGRYVLATGSTAAWSVGTHRAVCVYKMASGGEDLYQVIEFEMLTAADWVHPDQYLGYVSTKTLVDNAQLGAMTRAQMHTRINRWSRELDRILGRSLGPRYQTLKLNGENSSVLHLHEAIIAVEKVEAAAKDANQGDILTEFTAQTYRVFNRHMDGVLEEDDRRNPKIELVGDLEYEDSEVPPAMTYAWPHGSQNIWVTGVFGYVDPDVPLYGMGKTPEDIGVALQALIYREALDPTYSSLSVHSPGSVVEVQTRDQRAKFAGGGSTSMAAMWSSELTGDPMLDRLLMRFMSPPDLGYARR